MKTSLLVLGVMACACAGYARPDGEATLAEDHPMMPKNDKKVLIDLDELTNELRTKFADEEFLMEKFGEPAGYVFNTSSVDGDLRTISIKNKHTLSGSWVNKIPWGTLIDVVNDVVRKATD